MSSTPPSGAFLFVEPLEARIAPAGLLAKANLVSDKPSDQNYLDYNTPVTPGHLGFVAASSLGVVGPGIYALAMDGIGGTDEVRIFDQTSGFGPGSIFLQANAGKLIAFFQDKNGDGQVQVNELVGLAMGKKSIATVNGTVDGDVVTNLSNNGSLLLGGTLKTGYRIDGLSVGNVNGNILSSGTISNLTVTGTVNNVLAGTATNGLPYHFAGSTGPVTGTLQGGVYKDGITGASILGIQVAALTSGGQIHAGDGGLGSPGGSVNGVRILLDTDSFTIQGGTGGVGNSTVRGGIGGDVYDVRVSGVANSAVNHVVSILGGTGGADPELKGGKGGTVSGIFTSFESSDPTNINGGQVSADVLSQDFLVRGGDGGAGLKGGFGGSVLDSNIRASIPDNGTAAPEIQILGGAGGQGSAKGGNGGGISNIIARNLDTTTDALNSSILVQAGDAGIGKNGGSVSGATLLGQTLIVNAGNGGSGFGKGGDGGNLGNIVISNSTNLFTSFLTLNAGQGGDGGNGRGGNGGLIDTATMLDSDLRAFAINTGTHGNGGTGNNGVGGNGGAVISSSFNDSNFSQALAPVTLRSGTGGSGLLGGGIGGDFVGFQLSGTGFAGTLAAGSGGSILANGGGDGGAGGNMTNVSVANLPDLSSVTPATPGLAAQTLSVAAGSGGNGTGNGGAGGILGTVNVQADGNITLAAGNGGAGGDGAAGAGGASTLSGANSLVGTVSLITGNGGAVGAERGDGGGIDGFVASAAGSITIHAGNGGAGGAGGSITGASGTSLNLLTGLPNVGNLDVRAGDGSAVGGHAGAGGSIVNFTGSVSSGLVNAQAGVTNIRAGAGGGTADNSATKVGAGGAITNVTLAGSDNTTATTSQIVNIDAGSAGASAGAKKGSTGGTVDGITLFNLDAGTIVHHIAAGDGSSGFKKGADGGSITNIHVGAPDNTTADIGVRSGRHYGYAADQAGGLFAGVGGTGPKVSGVNGSVSVVTARAISSIVAGKDAKPHLVEALSDIELVGGTPVRANPDGSFINFATANLVGSVLNPNAPNASTFKYDANGPIDGLIAVRTNFTGTTTFAPEALLSPGINDPTISLADNREPGDPFVQTPAPAIYLA